jgi:hypothetical protein
MDDYLNFNDFIPDVIDNSSSWNDFVPSVSDDSFNFNNFSPDTNLNTSQLEKGFNLDDAKAAELARAGKYDPTAALPDYGNQDLGITQAMIDEYTKNYNPEGGFGSQWQTVGTNKVMVNDDGTGTVLDPTTNQTAFLTQAQVQALIRSGTLNSKASGYSKSSGRTSLSLSKPKSSATGSGSNAGALMALMAAAGLMGSKSGSSEPTAQIPNMTAERSQTDYSGTRPGSANVEYFKPTTYTPKAAGGGLMSLANGGMSDLGGYSDGGRLLRGPGDGVSDSIPATIGGKQPARLATGEFVVPARIVSELGNGSTEAGAKKLYAMMDRVQKARRRTKNVAADTKAHKYLPA